MTAAVSKTGSTVRHIEVAFVETTAENVEIGRRSETEWRTMSNKVKGAKKPAKQ